MCFEMGLPLQREEESDWLLPLYWGDLSWLSLLLGGTDENHVAFWPDSPCPGRNIVQSVTATHTCSVRHSHRPEPLISHTTALD
jgi:hypothetical protein